MSQDVGIVLAGKGGQVERQMADSRKRFRNNSGRMMLEFLYGEADWIRREDGMIVYPYTKLATDLQIRPNRQIECLNWLHEQGLIKDLTVGRTHVKLELQKPLGFVDTTEDPTPEVGGSLPWQA